MITIDIVIGHVVRTIHWIGADPYTLTRDAVIHLSVKDNASTFRCWGDYGFRFRLVSFCQMLGCLILSKLRMTVAVKTIEQHLSVVHYVN